MSADPYYAWTHSVATYFTRFEEEVDTANRPSHPPIALSEPMESIAILQLPQDAVELIAICLAQSLAAIHGSMICGGR